MAEKDRRLGMLSFFKQGLVGIKNIIVKDLFLDAESSDLVNSAWPAKKKRWRRGLCHRTAKYYDAGRGTRRCRALDIGAGKVFIDAPVPRVCCREHGVVVAAVHSQRKKHGWLPCLNP